MRKLIVEAVGTFFLVLTIGMTVIEPGAGTLAPVAIGGVLMAMVYAGGHISGAHYNPAVTLAVMLRGKATKGDLLGYWVAQVAGAALAAASVAILKDGPRLVAVAPAVGSALLAEFLFTFALAYVVLNVATARGNEGNSFFGLAIGFTVLVGAYAVGPISGAAFNPAVALGIVILGIATPPMLGVYLLANFAGGAAAAFLFNALDLGADKATTATVAQQTGLRAPGATSS